MKPRRMLVDQKCWDLAEHFLADRLGVTKDEIQELAEDFQRSAESAVRPHNEP